jgi:hypothetical protein
MREGIDSKHGPISNGRGAHPARRAGAPGFLTATAMMAALSACGGSFDGNDSNKINGSIEVPAGKPPGAVATVNGSIHIDDNAAVTAQRR